MTPLMTPFRDPTMPRPAVVLGVAGMLPFIALAIQVATGQPFGSGMTLQARAALALYGTVILSFLGGIQWGLAVASADRSDEWRRFGFSVLPSLVAFVGLWLGGRNGLIALGIGVGVWGVYEVWSTGLGEAPQWYGRLRLGLTIVTVAALAIAASYGPE